MSRTPTGDPAPESTPAPDCAAAQPPQRTPSAARQPLRRFLANNEHDRIFIAVAQAVAAKGYEATTVGDICAEAYISTRTFYEHFAGKQEAALATVEAGVDKVMADCREVFRATTPWPEAIWATFDVYTDWIACEPAFARLIFVETLSAGPAALDLLQSLMDAFAIFLEPGYELASARAPSRQLVDETVANGVFCLIHEYLLREPPQTAPSILPEIVRTILAPFLGVEAARRFVQERRDAGA
jgi:AcrR family transcriptional regulator